MNHGWEKKRLGEVCTLIGGGTPSKSNVKFYSGNIPWATVRDMSEYKITTTELRITQEAVEKSATTILPQGMIVISTHVGLGKICELMQATAINQDLKGVSFFDNSIDKYFFTYWYKSIANHIIASGRGATVKGVTLDFMYNLQIPVPSITIQKKIAKELDKLNELIEIKRSQLKDLDVLARSLFYETFGDPISNPNDFPIKTLKDVCVLKSGDSSANRLPDGNVPYVKVGDMNLIENKRGILTSSNFVNIGNKAKLLFPIGTTIFPKRGGAILTNKKRLTKVQICCDLNIMGAIPKSIHPIYLYFFFLEKDFSEIVDGSTVPQINNTDIYPLKILVPPISLQNEFATKIEVIEEQKSLIESSIADLETLLASRMDYWFND